MIDLTPGYPCAMLTLSFAFLAACSGGKLVLSDDDDTAAPVACAPTSERCDGVDNDCDDLVDDADPDRIGASTWFLDADGDGYGDAGHPDGACTQPAGMVSNAMDCDDANPLIHPDADEVCDDIDDDCDTLVDGQDDSLTGASEWYTDGDGDGYGDANSGEPACHQPPDTVSQGGDCEDANRGVNPGADEVCDDIDDDCDGLVDGQDDSLVDGDTWFEDADGDGFGDASHPTQACSQPDGYVANDLDCDDADAFRACAPWSCLDVLDSGDSVGDGLYWVDLGGTGITQAWCDMTTDGGGWTLVVWIEGTSRNHANNTAAVGDPAQHTSGAKYSDAVINTLTTGGYWHYLCAGMKDAYVRTASRSWTSMYVNSEDWSMDNDRDGTFECAANRSSYVFSDYPACDSGHSNYASGSDGTGCYVSPSWGDDGSLWAR